MASTGTGRRGALLVGVLVLVAGLAGAVALYVVSQRRGDEAIRDLARAPVGCDTTLSFTDTGTFYVFIEHLGVVNSISGDCSTPDEYSRDPDDPPRVTITLADDAGDDVDLDRLDGDLTYRLDDEFAGTATRRVEIESTGDYVVTVESDDGDDFVVSIGRDPASAKTPTLVGALASAVAGLVLGGGLMLFGIRRGRARGGAGRLAAPPAWPLTGAAPTQPPVRPLLRPPTEPPRPPPQSSGPWVAGPPSGPPTGPPFGAGAPARPFDERSPDWPPLAPPQVLAPPTLPGAPDEPADDRADGDVRDGA